MLERSVASLSNDCCSSIGAAVNWLAGQRGMITFLHVVAIATAKLLAFLIYTTHNYTIKEVL